jgi:hypothetical protein
MLIGVVSPRSSGFRTMLTHSCPVVGRLANVALPFASVVWVAMAAVNVQALLPAASIAQVRSGETVTTTLPMGFPFD